MRILVMMSTIIVLRAATNVSGGNTTKTSTKKTPAKNSTSGYCQDIFVLQPLHLPRSARKLTTGTRSVHESVRLQEKQIDRPPTPIPVLKRNATTFKKLPMIVPATNENIPKMISMM